MTIQFIQSSQNKQFKDWKKLLQTRGRKKQRRYLIEGIHLVQEALKTNQSIDSILIAETFSNPNEIDLKEINRPIYQLSASLFNELAQTKAPQGIIAVINDQPLEQPRQWRGRLLLVDAVQDPGNLGTMIRTAHGAGYDGVVLGKGTVGYLNDKVIRSTQGSLWHIPIYEDDLASVISALKEQNYPVYATALNQKAVSYTQVDYPDSFSIIVGNEGQGVHSKLIDQATQSIYIPMPGQAESLNVAVATGILLFHSVIKD